MSMSVYILAPRAARPLAAACTRLPQSAHSDAVALYDVPSRSGKYT